MDVNAKYKDALKRSVSGHESDHNGLPPYIIPGTPEESHWREQHPGGIPTGKASAVTAGSTGAHLAAQAGDLEALQSEVGKKKESVHVKDANGWTPLHEGARSGHLEVVRYLIDSGADANATTGSQGHTALYWAKKELGADHPIVALLESLGVVEIGPEL